MESEIRRFPDVDGTYWKVEKYSNRVQIHLFKCVSKMKTDTILKKKNKRIPKEIDGKIKYIKTLRERQYEVEVEYIDQTEYIFKLPPEHEIAISDWKVEDCKVLEKMILAGILKARKVESECKPEQVVFAKHFREDIERAWLLPEELRDRLNPGKPIFVETKHGRRSAKVTKVVNLTHCDFIPMCSAIGIIRDPVEFNKLKSFYRINWNIKEKEINHGSE